MRRNFTDGMEITFGDLEKISSTLERQFYDRVIYELLQQKTDKVFGDSFAVSRVSATQVEVAAGIGFQNDATVTSPEPTKRLLYRAAASQHNITTPDATHPRIDIVCIKHDRANSSTASRKYKAATTGVITTETLTVETDWQAAITIVAGTPGASPSAPSTPSGYLKIAELTVSALTGIAASGAISDTRTKLPVGGEILLSTLGLTKITAAAERKLDDVISDIDTLLGGGGGGGGGMRWKASGANAAVVTEENGEEVMLFPDAVDAEATVFFQVPNGYVAGNPISMYLGCYSPSSSGTFKMKAVTSLVRQGTDAITSTTNQHTSTNAALTNTVANQLRRVSIDLTASDGEVNNVAVSPGDILKVTLSRDYGSDTDTAEVRFIPSATEPKMSA